MSYNRRFFLKELGIAFALPVLHSLAPRRAFAQAGTLKDKFIGVFTPNGALMPRAQNGNWNFSQALQPVAAAHPGNVSILRGISATSNSDPHWNNTANFLSGNQIQVSSRAIVRCGKSFDQYVADKFSKELRSLHVGWRNMNRDFTGDHPNHSDQYLTTIAWRANDRPISNVYDPRQLFSQIFSTNRSGQERLMAMNTQKSSILDLTFREIQSIRSRVSQDDQVRLESFQDNLRALEKDLKRPAPSCGSSVQEPPSITDYQTHFRLMHQMIAAAMECDLISSATIMYDDGVGDVHLRHPGTRRDHHDYAHNPQLNLTESINRVHAGLFANLLTELKTRSLLEKTVLVWSSNMSDGSLHLVNNVPTVVASAGPGMSLGVEIGNPAARVPRANIFVELAPLFGLPITSFGAGVSASNGTRIPIRT